MFVLDTTLMHYEKVSVFGGFQYDQSVETKQKLEVLQEFSFFFKFCLGLFTYLLINFYFINLPRSLAAIWIPSTY